MVTCVRQKAGEHTLGQAMDAQPWRKIGEANWGPAMWNKPLELFAPKCTNQCTRL